MTPRVTHGTASVACAGSLDELYVDTIAPAFDRATGDIAGGPPCAGSSALASEILAGEINPGVFLAVGAHAIKELFPTKRSNFAMAIASNPLVVAYSRNSRYYSRLNAIKIGKKPLSDLFSLFTTPGFRLGRTDPTQDPQGVFFILMAKLAQKVLHLRAGLAAQALGITSSSPYGSTSQQYDEDALPVDIATGIVDAGSEYLPEAREWGLDYITLPPTLDFGSPSEVPLYSTVSLKVNGSVQQGEVIYLNISLVGPKKGSFPTVNEDADHAFVAFMLSGGRNILKSVGLVLAPGIHTAKAVLPAAILKLFKELGGTISKS
jgi:molybdate/tungstate transport system substrate-binding protein